MPDELDDLAAEFAIKRQKPADDLDALATEFAATRAKPAAPKFYHESGEYQGNAPEVVDFERDPNGIASPDWQKRFSERQAQLRVKDEPGLLPVPVLGDIQAGMRTAGKSLLSMAARPFSGGMADQLARENQTTELAAQQTVPQVPVLSPLSRMTGHAGGMLATAALTGGGALAAPALFGAEGVNSGIQQGRDAGMTPLGTAAHAGAQGALNAAGGYIAAGALQGARPLIQSVGGNLLEFGASEAEQRVAGLKSGPVSAEDVAVAALAPGVLHGIGKLSRGSAPEAPAANPVREIPQPEPVQAPAGPRPIPRVVAAQELARKFAQKPVNEPIPEPVAQDKAPVAESTPLQQKITPEPTVDALAAEFAATRQAPEVVVEPETVKPPEPPVLKPVEPPVLKPLGKIEAPVQESETFGIKKRMRDAEREARGAEPIPQPEVQTDQSQVARADAINAADPKAIDALLNDLQSTGRAAEKHEVALLNRHKADLKQEADLLVREKLTAQKAGDTAKLAKVTPLATAALDKLDNFDRITAAANTTAGRNLQALTMEIDKNYTLAERIIQRAQDKGRPLTVEEESQVQTLHDRIAELEKAHAESAQRESALNERLNDAFAKYQEAMTKAPMPSKTLTRADRIKQAAVKVRADAKARLRAKGYRVNIGFDPTDLSDVGLIAGSYLVEGGVDFGQWSSRMVADFGEEIKPQLQELWAKAQDEAETLRGRMTPDEKYARRVERQIADLNERIATGNFTPKPRPEPVMTPKRVAIKAELDLAKSKFQKARDLDLWDRKSKAAKGVTITGEVYDASRALMTGGEFSFVLRQGLGGITRPRMMFRALRDGLKGFIGDEGVRARSNAEITAHPDYPAAEKARLAINKMDAPLSQQEEAFMSRILHDPDHPALRSLGKVGKFAVKQVARFNNAGEAFLNRVRFDWFQTLRKSAIDPTPEELTQLAKLVNQATGRGDIGQRLAGAAPILNRTLFSPRFLASRIQLLTGQSLHGGTAQSRKIIAKEYVRFAVGYALYHSLIKLALSMGDDETKKTTVESDPRSSDFGKIRRGNTRIDLGAGMTPLTVLGARAVSGQTKTGNGEIQPLTGQDVKFGAQDIGGVAGRFFRSKLHPLPGGAWSAYTGKDAVGQPTSVKQEIVKMLYPITYSDMIDAFKDQGVSEGAAISILAAFGAGIQTYSPQEPTKSTSKMPEKPPAFGGMRGMGTMR